MLVAFCKKISGNAFDVYVAEVEPDDIVDDGDGLLVVRKVGKRVTSITVHGQKNARRRQIRLVDTYDALDEFNLTDRGHSPDTDTDTDTDTDADIDNLLAKLHAHKASKGPVSPPEPEPQAQTPPPPPKRQKAKKGPRAYRLIVWRVEWAERRYTVGEDPDKTKAERLAGRWEAAGFITELKPLRQHPRAKPGPTIWETPSDPVLCRLPGCVWAGDHLGPHLRPHGMSIQDYREVTGYQGPIMVNRAAWSLKKAHNVTRRSYHLKVGAFVVEVMGDTGKLWRIDKALGKGRFHLELVAFPDGDDSPAEDWQWTATAVEIVNKTRPVLRWAKRTKQEAEEMCHG